MGCETPDCLKGHIGGCDQMCLKNLEFMGNYLFHILCVTGIDDRDDIPYKSFRVNGLYVLLDDVIQLLWRHITIKTILSNNLLNT